MHLRILAHVQRHQVKAEGMDAPQQPLHGEQSGMLALVERQALGDQFDVGEQLRDLFVRIDIVVVSRLQALLDQAQEHPVRHVAVTCGDRVISVLEYAAIFLDLVEHALAEGGAVCRLAELSRMAPHSL